jgi:Na+/H+ antiporter NhaD/arsenite permease-like protein
LALGAVSVVYYLIFLPKEAHHRVLHTGLDYVSFIALIGSFYVVSGGIHISVRGEATPWNNLAFLFIGAVLSNLLGTTGASMLLIRPWLRMNRYRVTAHHVVFFIFIVSNVGGCLTPIGDPPLFLGYLKGIPFWWVAEHCWPMWAVGIGALLLLFFIVDYRNYLRAPREVRAELTEPAEQWRITGLPNLLFLAVIIAAVFLSQPPLLRELIMIGAAIASYFTTGNSVHEANHFNFHPIREVVILFLGIFATMMPALDWLQIHAARLGHPDATFFYVAGGSLSSVLDNAPTYLSFLSVIFGSFVNHETVLQVQQLIQNGGHGLAQVAEPIRQTFEALQKYDPIHLANKTVDLDHIQMAYLLGNPNLNILIVALSIGAVFFGANTYIGNGPNFMVKSIADHQKVHSPGFLGYIVKFTLPFMFPMLVLVWWIFFRH